jgi:AcrR family transcriptional regulator
MNRSTVGAVAAPVKKPRRYDASRRAAQAAATRAAVLAAARELFVGQGYRATTVSQIAQRSGVAVDTVYAAVGRKPQVLRELVETSLSGTDQVVPAEQRDYVQQIRAAPDARTKILVYAQAIVQIHQRLAPVFLALRDAAITEPDCAALWTSIAERRAANMRLFAAELRATGDLRTDLSDDEVADIVWSMNAVEYWVLLVTQRGWSAERFGEWLGDAWTRLLLAAEPGAAPAQPLC